MFGKKKPPKKKRIDDITKLIKFNYAYSLEEIVKDKKLINIVFKALKNQDYDCIIYIPCKEYVQTARTYICNPELLMVEVFAKLDMSNDFDEKIQYELYGYKFIDPPTYVKYFCDTYIREIPDIMLETGR